MILNEGKIALLRQLLRNGEWDLEVRIYANDFTPTITSVQADFTDPTNGYAPSLAQNIRDYTWPNPTINGSDQAESDGPIILWTCNSFTSPETIYGLYVTMLDETDAVKVLMAAAFATPIDIAAVDDVVSKKLNWYSTDLF